MRKLIASAAAIAALWLLMPADIVPGGGWCNAGDCVPAPPVPMGPIGSPWGWLPFGPPQSPPF